MYHSDIIVGVGGGGGGGVEVIHNWKNKQDKLIRNNANILFFRLCRPVAVAQRSAVVMLTAAWVGSALLYDKLTDGLVRNAPMRAAQVPALAVWSLCACDSLHAALLQKRPVEQTEGGRVTDVVLLLQLLAESIAWVSIAASGVAVVSDMAKRTSCWVPRNLPFMVSKCESSFANDSRIVLLGMAKQAAMLLHA